MGYFKSWVRDLYIGVKFVSKQCSKCLPHLVEGVEMYERVRQRYKFAVLFGKSSGEDWLLLLNLFKNRSIAFNFKDIGYHFQGCQDNKIDYSFQRRII